MSEIIFTTKNTVSPLKDAVGTSGCPIPDDPKLIAEGWVSRFFGDARMARDSAETYEMMKHEVRLEPIDTSNLKENCDGCKPAFENFFVVYTRKL
ncbi:MAG: hypothetical protein GY808_12575 [Gammaproteobacteria bacterium]|nr:hypothetical protein [Gammaproteobacteria bacterium]